MRYVTFEHGDDVRPGTLSDEGVRPFPRSIATMLEYLALDPAMRATVVTEAPIPLHLTTLLAPIRPRKNVFAVGLNYRGHADEIARSRGIETRLASVPTFFTKAPTSVADPGSTLRLSSKVSLEWDWEAELAVVIGRRCKDVAPEDALSVVFGTLEPGDVIATGTPDGVGFARTPPEFLKDGDRMEVEIGGIGILSNAISLSA